MNYFRRLPFPDHSFDVIHSRYSGLRYSRDITEFEALIYEIDRLVRPGGWIVHSQMCSKKEDFDQRMKVLQATASILDWEVLVLKSRESEKYLGHSCEDFKTDFSFRKPLTGANRPERH